MVNYALDVITVSSLLLKAYNYMITAGWLLENKFEI